MQRMAPVTSHRREEPELFTTRIRAAFTPLG